MLNELELTGRAATHVVQRADLGAALHREVVDSYLALKSAAAGDGIELRIVSGFRDFEAQARIWNMKYRGERPLYDIAGNVRDHAVLDEMQLIEGILCWSALPGASRHHWGTDFDLIDRAAMPENYRYQLLPEEYMPGGIFHPLRLWLAKNSERFGFFQPYAQYRGGVYAEPWHLSYATISAAALQLCTQELIGNTLRASDVLGKEHVLARLPEIYRRYVANISSAPVIAGQGPAVV